MELSQKSQALQFLQVQLLQLSRLGALPLQRLLPGRLAPKKKTRKIGKNWGKIGKHGMNNGIKMLKLGGSDDNSVFLCIQSSSSGGKKGTLSTIMGEFRSFSMGNCNDNGDK
jgi:hypothetical protein